MSGGVFLYDPTTLLTSSGVPAGSLPAGAIGVTASSGNQPNANAVATMPAVAGKTNYVTGFELTGGGATAGQLVIATLTGILGGTSFYIVGSVTGAAVPNAPLVVNFATPIAASAANTAIAITMPALGAGNTNAVANIRGYVV